MYEENLAPLPEGDFATVFADALATIERHAAGTAPGKITPHNVVGWARPEIQTQLAQIARRLLLPGSRVIGTDSLAELVRLALARHSCIVCLNHRSNLDVPSLYALLEDQGSADVVQRLIWISGRKLDEDVGLTKLLVQGVNRTVVTPRSWMQQDHSDQERRDALEVNVAAHRAIHELRHQGWIFALFPSATRIRPRDTSTTKAIEETDSYLKHFEYLLLGYMDGCTLPVTRDRDLTHEMPKADRVQYTFGKVLRSDAWRARAAARYPRLDQRSASALAVMEDIAALGVSPTVDPGR
jgi:glycerol-3-phosphate O-acyltransferase